MTTAVSFIDRGQLKRKFSRGCDTIHLDEIKLGQDLYTALRLVYGKKKSIETIEKSPAALFRRMRYGRRILDSLSETGNQTALILVEDAAGFMHLNKPDARYILTPSSRRWNDFSRYVMRLTTCPRWADGWTATAEALDDFGFAIAESIAVFMCYGIDSDDGVIFYDREDG